MMKIPKNCFLGYSAAYKTLIKQLKNAGVTVDSTHPLVVYLPCGVGGGPGGRVEKDWCSVKTKGKDEERDGCSFLKMRRYGSVNRIRQQC